MSRALGRVLAAGLLGAVAAVVWLALAYGVQPMLNIDFDRTPPRLLSGVYPNEQEPATGRTFAWTGEQVTLRLPGMDRRVDWTLALRVRGARAAGDNPELTFLADGVQVATHRTATDYEDIVVSIPARPDRRGLTLTIHSSSTFVPGPSDRRQLGVILDAMRLTPGGLVVPPRMAFAGAAVAAGAMGAAIASLGVTAGSAIGAAIVIAAGIAAAIGRGFAPFTEFSDIASRAGMLVALALFVGTLLVEKRTGEPLRNTARFAAAFSASSLLLKLLVLLHPDMPVGDAMFQAHRFQDVLSGHLFFTSTAPGGYLFPYAPGLYAFAALFANLASRGAADMALLRAVAASADAAAALLLYSAIVRARGDRLAGACAVAIYHLLPLDFGVLSVGNLTNAFAQSVSVGALVMMASPALRFERRWILAGFVALVTAAFLSHTSTFAILSVACVVIALLFWWRGGPALRSPALAVGAGVIVAAIAAVLLYYGHFMGTYRTELARIGNETAAAAPDAGGRGIMTRLISVPRYLYLYYGIPAMLLAVWGTIVMQRRKAADRFALTVGGWAAGCLLFLIVGILSPVDMRYYLAAIPVVALVAAIGASAAWAAGGAARNVAALLLAWTLVEGLRVWWNTLG